MSRFERYGMEGLKWEGSVWYHLTFFQEDEVEQHDKVRITRVHEYWNCPQCGHKNLNRSFVLMEDHVPAHLLSSRDSYRHVQGSMGCGGCQAVFRRDAGPRGGPLMRVNFKLLDQVPQSRADLLLA